MKLIAAITGLILIMLIVFLSADAFRVESARKRVAAVKIGDTKQQVRRVLGPPTESTVAGLFDSSETWVYGGRIDWHRLTSQPIRFRLFGPDADEVAVRFDNAGKVTRIIIPNQNRK